ncbi:hypothetical protein CEG14_09585 [Bordetella genomosp. 1]|uniref:Uncharacterized protein n=1 Tax=Bordetella genomosp. 1 TaxID=1395607 RepID=A0A261SEV6_9BORD|nr:hypothetical protein CEG14_09585 [Bordetella genomosp. 1]
MGDSRQPPWRAPTRRPPRFRARVPPRALLPVAARAASATAALAAARAVEPTAAHANAHALEPTAAHATAHAAAHAAAHAVAHACLPLATPGGALAPPSASLLPGRLRYIKSWHDISSPCEFSAPIPLHNVHAGAASCLSKAGRCSQIDDDLLSQLS